MRHPRERLMTWSAFVGIAGWVGILGLFVAWSFWPVSLPTVDQPRTDTSAHRKPQCG